MPASLPGASMSTQATTLRAFYERQFSNDGGVRLEQCLLIDDKRAGALEFNVVQWGKTELPPQAGIVVHVRGQSGKLAAVRIYDDIEPPSSDLLSIRPPLTLRAANAHRLRTRRSDEAGRDVDDESYERGQLGDDVRCRLRPSREANALSGPHRERFDLTGRPGHRWPRLVTNDRLA